MKMSPLPSVLLLGLLLVPTSVRSQPTPAPNSPATRPADERVFDFSQRTEVLRFAEQIAKGVNAGQAAALDDAMDMDALIDRAERGDKVNPDMERGYREGVKEQRMGRGMVQQLAGKPNAMSVLRTYVRGPEIHVLFRILQPGGGGNYWDALVVPRGSGFRIVDAYIYVAGQSFSELLRPSYLAVVAQSRSGPNFILSEHDQELLKHLKDFQQAGEMLHNGQFDEGLKVIEAMPPVLKRDKIILLVKMRLAQRSSETAYEQTLDEIQRRFPNDPGLDFLLVDSLIMKKRYDQAIATLTRVDQAVGGDAYLDVLRGSVSLTAGNLPQAREWGQHALKIEPTLMEAYDLLIVVANRQGDFDQTLALLTHLERNLGVRFNDLSTAVAFAEFVKSPQYAQWLKMPHPAAATAPAAKTGGQ